MTLKIFEQGADDIPVATPGDWPDLNVSAFQKYRSLENKIDETTVHNLMSLVAVEITEKYDVEIIALPLDELDEISFQYAVYELTYARLIPLLQVHNQLDSEKTDPDTIAGLIRQAELNSLDFQRRIPGFKSAPSKRVGSRVV